MKEVTENFTPKKSPFSQEFKKLVQSGKISNLQNPLKKSLFRDKPARLIIRLSFGFVSDLSSSSKKTNTETSMLSNKVRSGGL